MTLADLIQQLNVMPRTWVVGLGRPRSYRGSFDQLAFASVPGATVADMLKEAEEAVGATFQGYKGGDYVMTLDTECWLAEWGEGGERLRRAHLLEPAPRTPGDEFAEAWLKTGEALLAKKNAGTATEAELAVLHDAQLHAKDMQRTAPEVADDPKTLADESRRPLLDGTDYNDRLKAMCAEEFKRNAEYALTVLGEVVVRGIIEAAAKR